MNTIVKIEIKESNNLDYSISFTLRGGDAELYKVVQGQYESKEQRNHIRNNMDSWKKHFVGWDFRDDQDFIENNGKSITEVHLLTKFNEAISIKKFSNYFNDL